VRQATPALSYGSYREVTLTNRQYAFARDYEGQAVFVTVNNDDISADFYLPGEGTYVGALGQQTVSSENGQLRVTIPANSGEIWIPEQRAIKEDPVALHTEDAIGTAEEPKAEIPEVKAPEPAPAPEAPTPAQGAPQETAPAPQAPASNHADSGAYDEAFEKGRIAGLQEAILAIMEKNGNVTDQMRRDVADNVYHDSLITWIKSFR
jgi:hypothetical protein